MDDGLATSAGGEDTMSLSLGGDIVDKGNDVHVGGVTAGVESWCRGANESAGGEDTMSLSLGGDTVDKGKDAHVRGVTPGVESWCRGAGVVDYDGFMEQVDVDIVSNDCLIGMDVFLSSRQGSLVDRSASE